RAASKPASAWPRTTGRPPSSSNASPRCGLLRPRPTGMGSGACRRNEDVCLLALAVAQRGRRGIHRAHEEGAELFPHKDELTISFAHVAYQMQAQFERRQAGIASFQAWNREELERRIGEADVLVISGLWRNELLDRAKRLRFIQSIGAGTDQFSRDSLSRAGVRLASARGVNARAVSDHAMALMLALARRLPEARDNPSTRQWRGMISDLSAREDELGGKTLVVVGVGAIGGRLTRLAKAFDMRVIGIRRNPAAGPDGADAVHGLAELARVLPDADFVALTCPLTRGTVNLIDS